MAPRATGAIPGIGKKAIEVAVPALSKLGRGFRVCFDELISGGLPASQLSIRILV